MAACLKYQIFQIKVDSSNAHWAMPGTWVVIFDNRGHDRPRLSRAYRPRMNIW
jgi:hypothetical protein